jgi:hypothetical protein
MSCRRVLKTKAVNIKKPPRFLWWLIRRVRLKAQQRHTAKARALSQAAARVRRDIRSCTARLPHGRLGYHGLSRNAIGGR